MVQPKKTNKQNKWDQNRFLPHTLNEKRRIQPFGRSMWKYGSASLRWCVPWAERMSVGSARENQRKISTISTLKLSMGRVLKVTNRPPDLQLTKDLHFRHVAEWRCSGHSFSNWVVASDWRSSLWEKMGRTGAEKCPFVSLLSQQSNGFFSGKPLQGNCPENRAEYASKVHLRVRNTHHPIRGKLELLHRGSSGRAAS